MKKDRLLEAGFQLGEDGRHDGFSIEWLVFDNRKFGDILGDWIAESTNSDVEAFIDKHHLGDVLDRDEVIDLVSGIKAPSRELTHAFAAIIPRHIVGNTAFHNRAATARFRTGSVEAGSLARFREKHLEQFLEASVATPSLDMGTVFLDAVMQKVDSIASSHGKTALPEATIANLAKSLDMTTREFRGETGVKFDASLQKAEKLASIFGLEGEEFDEFVGLAKEAWSGMADWRKELPFSRSLLFLRLTEGTNQVHLKQSLDPVSVTVSGLERGLILPSPEVAWKIGRHFALSEQSSRILEMSAASSSSLINEMVDERLRMLQHHFPGNDKVFGDFSRRHYNIHHMLDARPDRIVANIATVADHFADKGIALGDYLQLVAKCPALITTSPEKTIPRLERLIEIYRDGLLKVEPVYSTDEKDGRVLDVRPALDFLNSYKFSLTKFDQKPADLMVAHARVTGGKIGSVTFNKSSKRLMEIVFESLGHIDPAVPVPAMERPTGFQPESSAISGNDCLDYARNQVLRSLVEQKIIDGKLEPGSMAMDWRRFPLQQLAVPHAAFPETKPVFVAPEKAEFTGVSTRQLEEAGRSFPPLRDVDGETIDRNIRVTAKLLAIEGVTHDAYLAAALSQPEIFTFSPARVIDHLEEVAAHFAADGLTFKDYMTAVLRQPVILTYSPEQVIQTVEAGLDRANSTPRPESLKILISELPKKLSVAKNKKPRSGMEIPQQRTAGSGGIQRKPLNPDSVSRNRSSTNGRF